MTILRAVRAGSATMVTLAVILAACSPAAPATSSPASAGPVSAPPSAPSPSPGESAPPAATPEPTAAGSAGTTFHVDLLLTTGRTVSIDVKDDSGRLLTAASGTPGDGASVEIGTVAVANEDPSTLRLTWSGPPCATDNFLLIESSTLRLTVVQPECSGDAIAFDRVLILTFAGPVSASDVEAILQAGGDTPG